MGRMLEALMRTEELPPISEQILAKVAPTPADEEPNDDEMPFVEVGGPRKAAEPKARLETAAPRHASLHTRPPLTVSFQTYPKSAPAKPSVAGELIAFHQPEHLVSQQYAALFTQIIGEQQNTASPTLAFTALTPGVGTTTSLLNLAVAGCCKHAQRIAVVDANLARPAAAARLGVNAAVGLLEVLQGKVALEQALQATSIKDLQVLPAGGATESPNSHVEAIRWVLAWLRQRFDFVFVDAPAWDANANMPMLLAAASAIYLVVDATESDKPEVRAFARDVARLGGRLGGLILTR